MALDKNYPEGKTYKQRGNYPVPFCTVAVDCKAKKCETCIKLNGKRTGFERK